MREERGYDRREEERRGGEERRGEEGRGGERRGEERRRVLSVNSRRGGGGECRGATPDGVGGAQVESAHLRPQKS